MPIIRWGHETEITDVEWLWKPYIPYGKVTIISAKTAQRARKRIGASQDYMNGTPVWYFDGEM